MIDEAVKLYQEGDRVGSARLISKIVEIKYRRDTEDYMIDAFGMEVNFKEGVNEN